MSGEAEPGLVSRGNIVRAASLAGVLACGLVVSGCGGESYTVEQAQESARNRYAQAFKALSPAEKFAVQYTQVTDVRELVDGADSLADPQPYHMRFNSTCLKDTVFDIAPSGGSRGALIATDENNRDRMTVVAGEPGATTLIFSRVTKGTRLKPVGDETRKILKDYGCKVGLQKAQSVPIYTPFSSWVK